MEQWLLTGGDQLSRQVTVPLLSHPIITGYSVGTLAGESENIAKNHSNHIVTLYSESSNPTNWCMVIPRH